MRTTNTFGGNSGGSQLISDQRNKPGPKPGNGTLLDEELAAELAKRVKVGASLHRAAISVGVHPKTAERWKKLARLGIVPYAELMYAVLEAQERWKTEPETPPRRPDQSAEKSRTDEGHGTTRELVGAPP